MSDSKRNHAANKWKIAKKNENENDFHKKKETLSGTLLLAFEENLAFLVQFSIPEKYVSLSADERLLCKKLQKQLQHLMRIDRHLHVIANLLMNPSSIATFIWGKLHPNAMAKCSFLTLNVGRLIARTFFRQLFLHKKWVWRSQILWLNLINYEILENLNFFVFHSDVGFSTRRGHNQPPPPIQATSRSPPLLGLNSLGFADWYRILSYCSWYWY